MPDTFLSYYTIIKMKEELSRTLCWRGLIKQKRRTSPDS